MKKLTISILAMVYSFLSINAQTPSEKNNINTLVDSINYTQSTSVNIITNTTLISDSYNSEQLIADEINFDVFPNPATNKIIITVDNVVNGYSIEIINALGKVEVSFYDVDIFEIMVDISKLQRGLYYARMVNNGVVITKKLIIE
ncbi:MAG: T9SS type A sorting domain-containing protein [Ichthyobacteriaceae bacterium]|nr:T9SS type A sorting domain-containing protein [Ichthyobacteriaceae bacterium]